MQIFIADGYIASEIETFEREESYTSRFTLGVKSGFGQTARTDFFLCVCFGAVARSLARFKKKGDYLFIRGSVKNNLYTDSQGKKKLSVSIICAEVQYGNMPKLSDGREDQAEFLKTDYEDNSTEFEENLPF